MKGALQNQITTELISGYYIREDYTNLTHLFSYSICVGLRIAQAASVSEHLRYNLRHLRLGIENPLTKPTHTSPQKPNLPHETEVQKSVTTVTTVTNSLESKTNPKLMRFKNAKCHKSVTKLSQKSHNPPSAETHPSKTQRLLTS